MATKKTKKEKLLPLLAFILVSLVLPQCASAAETAAQINLYNPTAYADASLVEIPAGLIAAPGTLDWNSTVLLSDGRNIPFAIREGGPHWKSELKTPDGNVRPQDIIVFSAAVEPQNWKQLTFTEGIQDKRSALTNRNNTCTVTYSDFTLTIDSETGMLNDITAFGERLLKAPLALSFYAVDPEVYNYNGQITSWPLLYQFPTVDVLTGQRLPEPAARFVSKYSSPAMTELNFEIQSGPILRLGLTYRIYPSGIVDILIDERPWHAENPWYEQAANITLEFTGEKQHLPVLATNFPMFQFKDYAASVPQVAVIHKNARAVTVELGQETINGRMFQRRLYLLPKEKESAARACAELADEGLVTDIQPAALPVDNSLNLVRGDADAVPAKILADKLESLNAQVIVSNRAPEAARDTYTVTFVANSTLDTIRGDGFAVKPGPAPQSIEIHAKTRFGLTQAAHWITDLIDTRDGRIQFPLIASNPWSDIRMVSMQSGPTEGDFVYGPEEGWHDTLDLVMKYGVNRIENNGEVSNWKTPLEYKYMPELMSDSLEENDPLTGWKMGYALEGEREKKFSDIAESRERSLRMFDYIHARGGKIDAAKHIDRCPSKFLKIFREAMKQQGEEFNAERGVCWSGPDFRQMLTAHLKELLEVYPLDGFAMQRGDAYAPCQCDECKAYLRASKTKEIWTEQYMLFYDLLKEQGFNGMVGLTPYHNFPGYHGRLDALLPEDMVVFGDGCGAGMLMRNYDTLVPFGETWLDSPFSCFKIPASNRMRRTVAGHNCYYMGGAIVGLELTYAAVGFFSWDPTLTPNLLRYRLGTDMFGKENAVAFVHLADNYERMFDLLQKPLLPPTWPNLTPDEKSAAAGETRRLQTQLRAQVGQLKGKVTPTQDQKIWFAMVETFIDYTEYLLRRLELIDEMQALAVANRERLLDPKGLEGTQARKQILDAFENIYAEYARLEKLIERVPPSSSRTMLIKYLKAYHIMKPWRMVIGGFQGDLDGQLDIRQFDTTVLTETEIQAEAGREFSLDLELVNTGCVPWSDQFAPYIEIKDNKDADAVEKLGLPATWGLGTAEPFVFGDRKIVTLKGTAPAAPGRAELRVWVRSPFSGGWPQDVNVIDKKVITVTWK